MRHKKFIWMVGFAAACFLLLTITACKKTTAPASNAVNQTSPVLSVEETKQQRLAWNLKTLIDPYEHAGHTNPKWDAAAKLALTEFACTRANVADTNEPWAEIISTNAAAAVQAGCQDPMVNYLFIKYAMSQTNSREAFSDAFKKCFDGIETESSYPNVRKFYVSLRTAEQVSYSSSQATNIPPEVHNYRRHAMLFLADALKEKDMPIGEVDDACHAMFGVIENNQKQYEDFYDSIENSLFKNWPDKPVVWLLKGEAFFKKAWFARGGGYANTVTEEGWMTFSNDLAIADKSLNHAWELDPKDPRIAVKMIWVELGQGQGRDRMGLWFNRAMELDPNDYDACSAKCLYLEPKWYGSIEEMLSFCRECVTNKEWGGRVPLILVDAHSDIPVYYLDGSEKTNYWKRPEVWMDVKSAYDRFFELNPNATDIYKNYAWHAYYAEQWDAFNELAPKIRPADYSFFGGKDEFDKMVQLAKENAGKPK